MTDILSRISVISDTHGLLRDDVVQRVKGSDLIFHAGDVGNQEVLDRLNALAPCVVVRGNVDTGKWAECLPKTEFIEKADLSIYMLHDIKELDLDPLSAGIQIVISGHSHKPAIRNAEGVIYLNPGSAGPRRFKLPISMGIITITKTGPVPEIVILG